MNRMHIISLLALVLSSFGKPQKTKPRLPEYFVNIPAGTYYTGESEPNKPTILSGNLYMSSYEVSNLQYREFLNEIWSSLS